MIKNNEKNEIIFVKDGKEVDRIKFSNSEDIYDILEECEEVLIQTIWV